MDHGARLARAGARRDRRRHRRARRGGQHLGDGAGRVRALRDRRRPPRLRARRRLAGRHAQRGGRPRGAARAGAASGARSRSSSSTGPTRRARASAAACSARARAPARSTPTACAGSPTATASRCRTRSPPTAWSSTACSSRGSRLEGAAAYLELHIEQGPVLERLDLPLGVVLGTFGVQRHRIRFTGAHAHAGATPMDVRQRRLPRRRPQRARLPRRRRRARRRAGDDGHGPRLAGHRHGVQRHVRDLARPARARSRRAGRDADDRARRRARGIAAAEGCEVEWERVWEIEPIPFDDRLIELADEVVAEVAGHEPPPAERAAARRGGDGARAARR